MRKKFSLSRADLKELKQISFRVAIGNGLSIQESKKFAAFMVAIAYANKLSTFEKHILEFIEFHFQAHITSSSDQQN